MKPLVSVITPYRNAKRFLPGFVDSLRSQTAHDWCCIMVDDGSSDGGPELLSDLVVDDFRFLLISNTNPKHWPGPASARNCALSFVTTPLVAFCDVDDLWHPTKLERQLSFHQQLELDLSVSAYMRFSDSHPEDISNHPLCPPSHLDLQSLTKKNSIPMLTVIIKLNILNFGFTQIPHEDYLFWLNLFQSHPTLRYGCIPEVLAFYRVHRSSITSNKVKMPLWTYRVFRTHGRSRANSLLLLFFWFLSHAWDLCSNRSLTIKKIGLKELQAMPPIKIVQH